MNNQQYLMECVIKDIVALISVKEKYSLDKAMSEFYNSTTFDKLSNFKTGLYRESSGYVYDLYKSEKQYGKFIQMEI